MPLEHLFSDDSTKEAIDRRKPICETFGVLANPYPSGAQTSANPHKTTAADNHIDSAVKTFYRDRKSHVIAATASQGIGKTNLLTAYETALREKLGPRGFFVIRYVADPEPSFEPLVRSVFEHLGEDHLRKVVEKLAELDSDRRESELNNARTVDIKKMMESLVTSYEGDDRFDERIGLSQQWLLGLPVRKAHREDLGVQFRLDTVESKTRTLRDMVYLSAGVGVLEGAFLLLDELEKQDFSRSKMVVLQYLLSLRAMIDALPKHLFMMLALTTDALNRYREMLPALKGRLADELRLLPIQTLLEARDYRDFYLNHAREEAMPVAAQMRWKVGKKELVPNERVDSLFDELLEDSRIEGVRQRDFLNTLHKEAQESINKVIG